MKARFVYSFGDVDSKLLKKEKGLRSKNKYSLKEAEAMAARVQNNWNNPTTITLNCMDTEDGNVYGFDGINITPFSKGATKKNLLPDIEDQILEASPSVISNADELIRSITDQYEQEPSPLEENKNSNKKNKQNKPKISLSLPFMSKKSKSGANDNTVELDETEEAIAYEEEPEVITEEEPVEQPVEQYEDEMSEEGEEQEQEQAEDYGIHDEDEEDEVSDQSLAVAEFTGTSMNQEQQNLLPGNILNNNLVAMKKYETVSLPKFEEYMDIGNEIQEIVKTMEFKLTPDNLFKFTHFSPVSISNTKLDQYRQSYIRKCLNEPKFEILREHYWKTVRAIQGDGTDRLREAYERAALEDYELKAKHNISNLVSQEQEEADTAYWEFVQNQENIFKEKENKKREEHEAEIKAFIAQKDVELSLYLSTEKERVDNIVEDRKVAIYSEAERKQQKMVEDEWYNVKAEYNRNLIDGKRLMLRSLLEEIQKANEDVWKNAQDYIDTICNKVDEKMPEFANDIESFNALEKQQHDIDMDIKKISIEESKANAEQLKAEQDVEKQRELEHENKMLKLRLETERQKLEIMEERQKNVNQPKEARSFGRAILGR